MMRLCWLGFSIIIMAVTPIWATELSDSLTIFDPTGTVVNQIQLFEDGSILSVGPIGQFQIGSVSSGGEDPNTIHYINVQNLVNPSLYGRPINVLESGTTLSDTVGISQALAGPVLFLAFNSDNDTIPFPFGPVGTDIVPEGNGHIDVTLFLNPVLVTNGFTAQFFSDPEVPEPASAGLLAAGLFITTFAARKRLRFRHG
jgi:hypothetical protein